LSVALCGCETWPHEQGIKDSTWTKRKKEVTGCWRKLHSEDNQGYKNLPSVY